MKLRIVPFIIIVMLLVMPAYATAQEETVTITDQNVATAFRDNLTFTMSADSEVEIVDVDLLYKMVGQIGTSRNQANFSPGTTTNAEFSLSQTEPGNYFPPGTELQYWWKITDADGNQHVTEKQTLVYMDERHDWETLENDRLTLYWYEGDDEFSQSIFERANDSLDTLEEDLGVMIEEPIKIFVYAGHGDFMDAYFISGQEWAGGAAFDRQGVVMMTVEPDNPEFGTIITTHEMTHLVVHQATDNFFAGDLTLPRWLDEGIAVYTSGEIYTRPDFINAIDQAVDDDELFTLLTLSSPFSSDPHEAVLSYAQSGAVVDFVIDSYGAEAVSTLLDELSEGALYDEALQSAIGLDTIGLDNAFRESIGLPTLPDIIPEPSEAVVAPEPATSVEETDVEEESQPEEEAMEEQPAEAGGSTEESVVQVPVPETVEEADNSFLGLSCCLAGLIPLLFLGMAWVFKS